MKIAVSVYLEILHRYVFDNIYVQEKRKKSIKDRWVLFLYKVLSKKFPNWRSVLKEHFGKDCKKYKRYNG